MIQLNQLYKTYGKLKVLRAIDLELSKPGVTAILGPNGSGKSTLIKLILGLVILVKAPSPFRVKKSGNRIHTVIRSVIYRKLPAFLKI